MSEPFRVLVTGSRDWTDPEPIRRGLRWVMRRFALPADKVTVVHGAAKGADSLAAAIAREYGMTTEAHRADWGRHGNTAGIIRNTAMVKLGADVCLAYPLGLSAGTRHCMRTAAAAGIPVYPCPPDSL